MGFCELRASPGSLLCPAPPPGTIPPIKSAQGEGDDVKKLFTIGCPVILATLGVALLFVVRKKRKEKRLKRLRGGGLFYQHSGREGGDSQPHWPPFGGPQNLLDKRQNLCPLKGIPATQTFLSLLSYSQLLLLCAPGILCLHQLELTFIQVHTGKAILIITYANTYIFVDKYISLGPCSTPGQEVSMLCQIWNNLNTSPFKHLTSQSGVNDSHVS